MTFSLTKVLATLLAIAQFSNNTPDIVRSYDPNQKEVIAADLGKGCRALFSDDKFFTAAEIDTIVAQLRERAEAQRKAEEAEEKAKPPAALAENPPAEVDDSQAADGDSEEEPNDAGDPNNSEGDTPTQDKFAEMMNGMKLFKDLTFIQALDLWEGVCREPVKLERVSFIDWEELARQYNSAVATLPDYKILKGYRLPETSFIYDSEGGFLREIYSAEARRTWIDYKQIPEYVRLAFISAEDKEFLSHKGIQTRGVLRGFLKYLKSKKVEGGSTITQQVIKNILVGNDVSLDRKVKEMLLAKLVEQELTKEQILELYLNLINLGRSSWGIEMAAQNYFGKSVRELNTKQAAFLAGATHSPNRYEPSSNPEGIEERIKFVLDRMVDDKALTKEAAEKALKEPLDFIERKRQPGTNYFASALSGHLRDKLDKNLMKNGGLKIRTTLHPGLQNLTQAALQEGLFEFELKSGGMKWFGPVGGFDKVDPGNSETWVKPLTRLKEIYSDMSWNLAVVLAVSKTTVKLGIDNGQVVEIKRNGLQKWANNIYGQLQFGDAIWVHDDGEGQYSLRMQPRLQGAVVAMEPSTGRVLALAGGFSSTFTQFENGHEFNRAIEGFRQPGSTLKPFTYLTALQDGMQPNTLLRNEPVSFPRVRENKKLICKAWSPDNYREGGPAVLTMRRGLETSNNRVTAQIIRALNPDNFMIGLDRVREVTKEFGIYDDPFGCMSFILGADETSVMRMVTAYAQIANGGYKVVPRFVDTLESTQGQILNPGYAEPQALTSVDPVSLYQLRYILEGVLDRGTATSIKDLSGIVAGKTGTSNKEKDAWFVGFTNDLVIGIWVGYDNPTPMGKQGTGGHAALPIFEKIIRPSFEIYKAAAPLHDPPPGVEFALTQISNGRVLGPASNRVGKGRLNEAYREGYLPFDGSARPEPEINGEIEQDDEPTYSERAPIIKHKKKKKKNKKKKKSDENENEQPRNEGFGLFDRIFGE